MGSIASTGSSIVDKKSTKRFQTVGVADTNIDDTKAKATENEIYLGNATDKQLISEISRRHLIVHDDIAESMVKGIYEFETKLIGSGVSAKVYRVIKKETGVGFACKIIKKDGGMNDFKSMINEVEIMKRVRHRYVVSMHELFESPTCFWLILELADGGDLRFLMEKHKPFSEAVVRRYTRQILEGLEYLHSRGVVHRDIKLDNLLLHGDRETGDTKIADFGLSALVKVGTASYDCTNPQSLKGYDKLDKRWGCPLYCAPELVERRSGPQADLWSLGCIVFEMLTGNWAFEPLKERTDWREELSERIKIADYDRSQLAHLSSDALNFIDCLLRVDPLKRLSAAEAQDHPWLSNQHWQLTNENTSVAVAKLKGGGAAAIEDGGGENVQSPSGVLKEKEGAPSPRINRYSDKRERHESDFAYLPVHEIRSPKLSMIGGAYDTVPSTDVVVVGTGPHPQSAPPNFCDASKPLEAAVNTDDVRSHWVQAALRSDGKRSHLVAERTVAGGSDGSGMGQDIVSERLPDVIVHATLSEAMDDNHDEALIQPLWGVQDESLVAEVARRKIALYGQGGSGGAIQVPDIKGAESLCASCCCLCSRTKLS